jgi:hypothetical protein
MGADAMSSPSLIGNAGVHFVAARLSFMNLICAPTFRNVPNVDLLVSNESGSSTVSLQVKTSSSARRPKQYEWQMNWKSTKLNSETLYFALVDLKRFTELPDIFIVPSSKIFSWFQPPRVTPLWIAAWYKPTIEELNDYKNENGFNLLLKYLQTASPQSK